MTTERRTPIGPTLAIVGGAALVIGSFLTWVTLSGQGESASATGIDGSDGWITFTAGLIAAATGIVAIRGGRRALAILAILAGLVGGGVGVYDATTIRDQIADEVATQSGASQGEARAFIDQAIDSGQLELSVGVGLFVVIGGGVLALIGGAVQLASRGAGTPSMPASAPVAAMPPSAPPAGSAPPPTPPPAPAPPPDTPPS